MNVEDDALSLLKIIVERAKKGRSYKDLLVQLHMLLRGAPEMTRILNEVCSFKKD